MNLLLVSPALPPHQAGEAEYASLLTRQLVSQGHQVTVLTEVQDGQGEPMHQGARLYPIMRTWGWSEIWRLMRVVREVRPDGIIIVFTDWLFRDHPMITFVPLYLKWMGANSRVLTVFQLEDGITPDGLGNRVAQKLLSRIARLWGLPCVHGYGALLAAPHAVAALGSGILQNIRAKAPSPDLRAVLTPPPPLLPPEQDQQRSSRTDVRSRLGVPDHAICLAYFGYVYPGKGVETLLNAVRRLKDQDRDIHLLMVGGGRHSRMPANAFEQRMQALCESLELIDCVHWLQGYESGSVDSSAELAAADMATLPFDDGVELRRSSVAVVAAAGLPLITTHPQETGSPFKAEENSLLCSPQDAIGLSDAITRIADDQALSDRLRAGSKQLVREWFSWQRSIQLMESALSPDQALTH